MSDGQSDAAISTDQRHLTELVLRKYGIVMRPRHAAKACLTLQGRAAARGAKSLTAYFDTISTTQDSEDEFHLLDQVTTNVTSFFREPHHFESIRKHVSTLPRSRALRFWSAGCSSGQEPWSILLTIAAHLDGQMRRHVLVLGTDIDPKALSRAHTAIYPIRELDCIAQIYHRHLKIDEKTVQPHPSLRPLIRIRKLNLIEPFPFEAQFDVIMCRNTLIYFEVRQREDVVRRLAARLRPGGLLILGHSETLLTVPPSLVSDGQTVYRRVI